MTLNLELPPATEAQLRATARARGIEVEEAIREALDEWTLKGQTSADDENAREDAKARRRAAIEQAQGIFRGRGRTSDDFLRERHEEAQRELEKDEARWREREAREQSP